MAALALVVAGGCAARAPAARCDAPVTAAPLAHPAEPVVSGPAGALALPVWTPEEEAKDVALRLVRKSDVASYHVVRVRTAEKPHVHDRSDVTVTILRGTVRMHVGDHVVVVSPGDVVDIPRGVVHFAENDGSSPSLAYVVFAPAFDGEDQRFVPPALP